jgi:putative isomerase
MRLIPSTSRIALSSLTLVALSTCSSPQVRTTATGPIDSTETLQAQLGHGWNTWNNPSLLSHVLLPEGLAVSIVMRNKTKGPYWMRDALIQDVTNLKNKISVRPRLRTYDGRYTDLDLEWFGTQARIRSATDGDDIVVLYAPTAKAERTPVLLFETALLWNRPGTLEHQDDGAIKAHLKTRDISIRTTSPSTNHPLPLGTPYFSFDAGTEVAFYTGRQRSLPEIRALLDARQLSVQDESKKYGDLQPAYQAMQAAAAWNVMYEPVKRQVVTPVSRTWNEAWGGIILFDWDTYFTALMMATDDRRLAYANAIAITNETTDRGFIPNVAAAFDVKSNDRSQPPVGAITSKVLYDKFGDRWFLQAVYPNLLRWNRWWHTARNNQGFLSWGSDPHPKPIEPSNKQAAKYESGLDNSPLFEEANYNEKTHLLDLADVGLMSLYIADCKKMAEIATILGNSADAAELTERANRYTEKLQELWDEETGIYRDRDLTTGKWSTHLAPTNFYPLIAGVPTQAQAERMINEHFFNDAEFGGEWIMPSIARNDPAFADNDYWRGRIWAPMNFLVYLGLRNYDLPRARKHMAERSVALILKEWKAHGHVHENYNSQNGEGHDVKNSDSFYSWGGLLGLIGIMEAGLY